jgi:tRNA A-37 threonylcarbamoyl transferase component Bud32
MLHDISAGMMYLHSRQFVHGDLRSPNLFVARDGKVCAVFVVLRVFWGSLCVECVCV